MFEIELFICIKMDLALNNQQGLICKKTKPNRYLPVHFNGKLKRYQGFIISSRTLYILKSRLWVIIYSQILLTQLSGPTEYDDSTSTEEFEFPLMSVLGMALNHLMVKLQA